MKTRSGARSEEVAFNRRPGTQARKIFVFDSIVVVRNPGETLSPANAPPRSSANAASAPPCTWPLLLRWRSSTCRHCDLGWLQESGTAARLTGAPRNEQRPAGARFLLECGRQAGGVKHLAGRAI